MATVLRDTYGRDVRYSVRRQQMREEADTYRFESPTTSPRTPREVLTDRTLSLRQANAHVEETLAAIAAARPVGLDDPQFWLVSIRYSLHCAERLSRVTLVGAYDRPRIESLKRDALADVEQGIATLNGLAASGDRLAYPWGLALVRLAAWMDVYHYPGRIEPGAEKYPYRGLAAKLYQCIIDADIESLFGLAENEIREDIDRNVTGWAASQLTPKPHVPGGNPRIVRVLSWLQAHRTWIRRSGIAVLIVIATLLADSSLLMAMLELAGPAMD